MKRGLLARFLRLAATTTAYCPVCGKPLSYDAKECPNCSADIAEWNKQGFVEKLIGALSHPLSDIRMRAIIVLGNRRETSAQEPLVECALRYPVDVLQGIAVVNSLTLIREISRSSVSLQRLAQDHPARAVRQAALEALSSA
jgi:hypothetical protein